MANNLTGDYEAVVEVSVRQINGLLATLHQNGMNEDAPVRLLHSASLRVGDPRRPRFPTDGDFGAWVQEYRQARGPIAFKEVRAHLIASAPPGAAKLLVEMFSKLGAAQPPAPPADIVRGLARVQLSSLTVSLASGSTTEVSVHAFVRGQYVPDAGTTDLPKPLHGEVQAAFEVWQVQTGAGRRLMCQPSSDDSKIQFHTASGTGLSATDVAKVSQQVRNAVRENFPLLPVDLPSTFPFPDFKGVGTGPGQAIALPLQLSGAARPPGGIQSVHNLFTGPSGFAFAVSKEFVTAQFQGTIDTLMQFALDIPVVIIPHVWEPTYHVSVTNVDIRFNDGSIDLTVRAKATAPWAPDYDDIVITQRVALAMFLDALFILAPDDELAVAGLPDAVTDRVKLTIIAQRNQAIPTAQAALNQKLGDARTKLNDALHSFDPFASASFRAGFSGDAGAASTGAIAITTDGVIVRGDIGSTAGRHAPIIEIGETMQGQAFTALNSCIPGGWIERMTWSWVEYTNPSIWSGVTKSAPPEEHRFVFPKPPGITHASSICLHVEGTQTSPLGVVSNVAGGTTCQVPDPGQVLEAPSWLEPVTVPIWLPGSPADGILKDVIAGHVSVQADTPQKNEFTHNFLVYFADWRADKSLDVLVQALGQLRRKDFSLVVIMVLPAGAFDGRRREVEARLHSISERLPARLLLTEDDEGGWTRTFAVAKTPSFYLMNARREFVWKHEGAVDPKVLAAALNEHLMAAPVPRTRPLRLAVSPGEFAPDVQFADGRGNTLRLRRLRGRTVLLNFWQSWSAPSIKELARLERLQKEAGAHAPFIVAFHGGKERTMLDAIRKQHGFSFVLAHDSKQRIARSYGVRCWPTTILINSDGRIDQVQFGIMHEHTVPPKGKEAEAH